ncbi:MAG: hypothetical protein DCC58_06560 [Chloroflexi bacterium]|nr:MAG: hypothetical protein DCC58_06560 [Chloroflexota bacterium]
MSAERVTPVSFVDLLRRLDWRFEALGVALVLAEAAVIYVLAGFVMAGNAPEYAVLPAAIIILNLLVAHIVPHLMDEWRIWSPHYEMVLGVAIGVTTLVSVKVACFPHVALSDPLWVRDMFNSLVLLSNDAERPVWGIVALAAYAWWRGRTREEPSIDSAYTLLRFGSAALALFLIIVLAAAPDGAQIRERLSFATLSYFLCTLVAIGIARLKLEGFRTSAPLGPRWIATFVAPIVVVGLVAIILAGIFSRQFLDTVLWILSPVFWFLAIVFQVFVILMALIAFLILTPIFWAIGTREPRVIQQTPTVMVNPGNDTLQQRMEEAVNVPDPLRYLIAALLLFVIFSALMRFVFRRRRRTRDVTDEQRESVLDWSDVLGNAATRLRNLFRRSPRPDPYAHLRGDPRWRYTLEIRETYARLQERGAKLGRARRPAETADEYQPALSARLQMAPDAPSAVAGITARYDVARYSGEPASEADAAAVSEAWQRLGREE